MRRGETIVSNVVDIPFVLALFYLPPVTLIIVRVLTAVIMQMRRKSTPVKFAFNVANLSAATSVAAAVVYAQGERPTRTTPEGWVVLGGRRVHRLRRFAAGASSRSSPSRRAGSPGRARRAPRCRRWPCRWSTCRSASWS